MKKRSVSPLQSYRLSSRAIRFQRMPAHRIGKHAETCRSPTEKNEMMNGWIDILFAQAAFRAGMRAARAGLPLDENSLERSALFRYRGHWRGGWSAHNERATEQAARTVPTQDSTRP
ncbi:hypothetical protein [Cupriavidus necator]